MKSYFKILALGLLLCGHSLFAQEGPTKAQTIQWLTDNWEQNACNSIMSFGTQGSNTVLLMTGNYTYVVDLTLVDINSIELSPYDQSALSFRAFPGGEQFEYQNNEGYSSQVYSANAGCWSRNRSDQGEKVLKAFKHLVMIAQGKNEGISEDWFNH